MKFGIRNISFVYPNGTGNIWADTKAQVQRAERDESTIEKTTYDLVVCASTKAELKKI